MSRAHTPPGGTGRIGTHVVAKIGYGAMGLAEPPLDDALAVVRRAIELGVNHIDTASFYGGGVVEQRLRQALAPYADDLVIVSKVGARAVGNPVHFTYAQQPHELRAALELDLAQLGIERIPIVNLRRAELGPGPVAEGDQAVDLDDQLAAMVELRDEGKIGAIGISNIGLESLERALPVGIVCVQNAYSVLDRTHEPLLDVCLDNDVAWVPYFPLGSAFPFLPKVADNEVVQRIASDMGVTPAQVGLAWLLAQAPNTLLIAGTTSIPHLEENLAVGDIELSAESITALDGIASSEADN